MTLASVLEQLSRHLARSLTESDGVSDCETPRRKPCDEETLSPCAESAESESMSYTCAGARARARARDVALAERDSPDSGVSMSPPAPATILKHCRCRDCRKWIGKPYSECRHGIIRNGVKEPPEYPAEAWHYCALYRGPQISKDVWVWPKRTGATGPSGGQSKGNRGGNRRAACLFRSEARTAPKE